MPATQRCGHGAGNTKEKYPLTTSHMASGELPAAKVRPQDERYGGKLSFWERLER